MLNSDLDISRLKAEYAKKNRVQIESFLDKGFAEAVLGSLERLTRKNLWTQVAYGNFRYYDPNSPKNPNQNPAYFSFHHEKYPVVNMSFEVLAQGEDSTGDEKRILRTKDAEHKPLDREDPIQQLSLFLNSNETHALISEITQTKLSNRCAKIFASKFNSGDYLSVHDDGGLPRRIAFVLNMTKDWLVHWGGNLVILNSSFSKVIETFTPSFNSLVLFEVPLPHAVLPISNYCQVPRYALAGWYQYIDQQVIQRLKDAGLLDAAVQIPGDASNSNDR